MMIAARLAAAAIVAATAAALVTIDVATEPSDTVLLDGASYPAGLRLTNLGAKNVTLRHVTVGCPGLQVLGGQEPAGHLTLTNVTAECAAVAADKAVIYIKGGSLRGNVTIEDCTVSATEAAAGSHLLQIRTPAGHLAIRGGRYTITSEKATHRCIDLRAVRGTAVVTIDDVYATVDVTGRNRVASALRVDRAHAGASITVNGGYFRGRLAGGEAAGVEIASASAGSTIVLNNVTANARGRDDVGALVVDDSGCDLVIRDGSYRGRGFLTDASGLLFRRFSGTAAITAALVTSKSKDTAAAVTLHVLTGQVSLRGSTMNATAADHTATGVSATSLRGANASLVIDDCAVHAVAPMAARGVELDSAEAGTVAVAQTTVAATSLATHGAFGVSYVNSTAAMTVSDCTVATSSAEGQSVGVLLRYAVAGSLSVSNTSFAVAARSSAVGSNAPGLTAEIHNGGVIAVDDRVTAMAGLALSVTDSTFDGAGSKVPLFFLRLPAAWTGGASAVAVVGVGMSQQFVLAHGLLVTTATELQRVRVAAAATVTRCITNLTQDGAALPGNVEIPGVRSTLDCSAHPGAGPVGPAPLGPDRCADVAATGIYVDDWDITLTMDLDRPFTAVEAEQLRLAIAPLICIEVSRFDLVLVSPRRVLLTPRCPPRGWDCVLRPFNFAYGHSSVFDHLGVTSVQLPQLPSVSSSAASSSAATPAPLPATPSASAASAAPTPSPVGVPSARGSSSSLGPDRCADVAATTIYVSDWGVKLAMDLDRPFTAAEAEQLRLAIAPLICIELGNFKLALASPQRVLLTPYCGAREFDCAVRPFNFAYGHSSVFDHLGVTSVQISGLTPPATPAPLPVALSSSSAASASFGPDRCAEVAATTIYADGDITLTMDLDRPFTAVEAEQLRLAIAPLICIDTSDFDLVLASPQRALLTPRCHPRMRSCAVRPFNFAYGHSSVFDHLGVTSVQLPQLPSVSSSAASSPATPAPLPATPSASASSAAPTPSPVGVPSARGSSSSLGPDRCADVAATTIYVSDWGVKLAMDLDRPFTAAEAEQLRLAIAPLICIELGNFKLALASPQRVLLTPYCGAREFDCAVRPFNFAYGHSSVFDHLGVTSVQISGPTPPATPAPLPVAPSASSSVASSFPTSQAPSALSQSTAPSAPAVVPGTPSPVIPAPSAASSGAVASSTSPSMSSAPTAPAAPSGPASESSRTSAIASSKAASGGLNPAGQQTAGADAAGSSSSLPTAVVVSVAVVAGVALVAAAVVAAGVLVVLRKRRAAVGTVADAVEAAADGDVEMAREPMHPSPSHADPGYFVNVQPVLAVPVPTEAI